ncbi:uncharacterized protein LOC135484942 [Lineus longissimus]|uniref:uncharacterized protein LOC135484942 n=1 Tax=Lineus longissimus TaxID=88925 RepID=UPI002B4C54CF
MAGYSWTHSSQERDPRKRNMAWATPPSSAGRSRSGHRGYDGYEAYTRTTGQRYNSSEVEQSYPSYSQSSNPGKDIWDSRPPVRPQSASVPGRPERSFIRRSSGLDRIPEASAQDKYSPVYRTTFEETYLVPKEPANSHIAPDRPWTAGPRISTKDFELFKDRVQVDCRPERHQYNRWHHYD